MKRFLPAALCLFLALGCDAWRMPSTDTVAPPVPVDPQVSPLVTTKGFRFLIIEKGVNRTLLPPDQQTIFADVNLRHYLRDNCAKQADGKTPDFHFMDYGDVFNADGSVKLGEPWASVIKAKKPTEFPWLVSVNGKRALSVKLPSNSAGVMSAVKPIAEAK